MLPSNVVIAPPIFDPIAAYGIGGIAVIVAIVWVVIFSRRNGYRAIVLTLGVVLLMTGSAIAALSGQLSRFDFFPPPMFIMLVSITVIAFAIGLSSFGRDAAAEISLYTLIGLQSFRFPLELVMHYAGGLGIMQAQLSYSGYNFDIITGIGALVLFVMHKSSVRIPLPVLWVWNIWGSLCLVVIYIIAITTSPVVRAFGDEPQNLNTWVLYFPYVWLPVVLVTIAISSHIIITRRLFTKGVS